MKKPLFVSLVLSLILSACLPAFLQQQPVANNDQQAPQVDIQATAAVIAATMAVQTINALPTPTAIPPSKVVAVSPTPTTFATIDPNIMVTTTMLTLSTTGTVTTATPGTATQTPTPGNGIANPSQTPHLIYYGTLPPKLPYGSVLVKNKAEADAYISLQCTTGDGQTTIIEFPIKREYKVNAPSGHYVYVAWVGGNKMMGTFTLSTRQDLIITLYKEKVSFK